MNPETFSKNEFLELVKETLEVEIRGFLLLLLFQTLSFLNIIQKSVHSAGLCWSDPKHLQEDLFAGLAHSQLLVAEL